jgi:methyl acetate hydrolase
MTGRVEIAARLDEVLRRSVEAHEVPGVVAMVANDRDLIYEGAFGVWRLGDAPAMSLETVFNEQSGDLGRSDATGRARQTYA